MKNIVIIFGGASVEHDVSIVTGLQAIDNLKDEYNIYPIYLSLDNKFYYTKNLKPKNYLNKDEVIKNSKEVFFYNSNLYNVKGKKLKPFSEIDCVLNCCHGGVGENGVLASFFEITKTKITSATAKGSSVSMSKYFTKLVANAENIPTVNGVLLNVSNYKENLERINQEFADILIIKPNNLGSSIGVIKCDKSNIEEQLETALHLDDEVLVENCVENLVEYNCAVLTNKGDLCLSQIEKVGVEGVLSFEDKYCSKSSREIPAKADDELKSLIYSYTKKIYKALNLSGVVRVDYLYDYKNKKLYLNEVNTIPGSLAFYLFQGIGLDYKMLCENLIENTLPPKKQTYFESDILTKTSLTIK